MSALWWCSANRRSASVGCPSAELDARPTEIRPARVLNRDPSRRARLDKLKITQRFAHFLEPWIGGRDHAWTKCLPVVKGPLASDRPFLARARCIPVSRGASAWPTASAALPGTPGSRRLVTRQRRAVATTPTRGRGGPSSCGWRPSGWTIAPSVVACGLERLARRGLSLGRERSRTPMPAPPAPRRGRRTAAPAVRRRSSSSAAVAPSPRHGSSRRSR